MSNAPMINRVYKHFKGNLYQVLAIAEHSETGEELVIYQALYGDYKIYARPLAMFMEKVDKVKYPDVAQEYRFEPVGMQPVVEEAKPTPVAEPTPVTGTPAQVTGTESLPIEERVLEFLDAETAKERLNILTSLHHRITDDMINTMAIAADTEIPEGDIETRYQALRETLLLYHKFETNRLR